MFRGPFRASPDLALGGRASGTSSASAPAELNRGNARTPCLRRTSNRCGDRSQACTWRFAPRGGNRADALGDPRPSGREPPRANRRFPHAPAIPRSHLVPRSRDRIDARRPRGRPALRPDVPGLVRLTGRRPKTKPDRQSALADGRSGVRNESSLAPALLALREPLARAHADALRARASAGRSTGLRLGFCHRAVLSLSQPSAATGACAVRAR